MAADDGYGALILIFRLTVPLATCKAQPWKTGGLCCPSVSGPTADYERPSMRRQTPCRYGAQPRVRAAAERHEPPFGSVISAVDLSNVATESFREGEHLCFGRFVLLALKGNRDVDHSLATPGPMASIALRNRSSTTCCISISDLIQLNACRPKKGSRCRADRVLAR